MRDQAHIGEAPSIATLSREALVACLMGGAVICAFLWDFRIHGIRLFDVVGVLLLSSALAWQAIENRRNRPSLACVSLVLLFIIYCGYSFFYAQHKSSIAIAIGALIFLGLVTYDTTLIKITITYRIIAIASILIFFLQAVSYTAFDILVDPHSIFDTPSRVLVNESSIRPAGLFQEPASYCQALFMLISLITAIRPSYKLTFITALTMLISQSLWGWGAGICTIALYFIAQPDRSWKIFISLAWRTIALLLVTVGILFASKPANYDYPPALGRLTQIHKDPSLQERYIQNNIREIQNNDVTQPPPPLSDSSPLAGTLLGNGLSTHYFLQHLPANGFALIWNSFGIIGSSALITIGFLAGKPMAPWRRAITFMPIIFIMTNYPLFSYLWFWIWLAAMFMASTQDDVSRS